MQALLATPPTPPRTERPDAAHSEATRDTAHTNVPSLTAQIGAMLTLAWVNTAWVIMAWHDAEHQHLAWCFPAEAGDVHAATCAQDWARLSELLHGRDDAIVCEDWVMRRQALDGPADHGRWIYEAEQCGAAWPPEVHSLPDGMTPSEWLEELTRAPVVAPEPSDVVLRLPGDEMPADALLNMSGARIPF